MVGRVGEIEKGKSPAISRRTDIEDRHARSLQREYRTLVKERSRSSNRIKGLLASQGLVTSAALQG